MAGRRAIKNEKIVAVPGQKLHDARERHDFIQPWRRHVHHLLEDYAVESQVEPAGNGLKKALQILGVTHFQLFKLRTGVDFHGGQAKEENRRPGADFHLKAGGE